VIASLAVISAAAVQSETINGTATSEYHGQQALRFVVRLSSGANENAVHASALIHWVSSDDLAERGVRIVPESDALPPLELLAGATPNERQGALVGPPTVGVSDGGFSTQTASYDLTTACPDSGACELHFHVEAADPATAPRGEVTVSVTVKGHVESGACAEAAEFPSGATVSVDVVE
jgi:hypothetical protein